MDLPLLLRNHRELEYTGVSLVEALTGMEVYVGTLVKQVTVVLVEVDLLAGVVSGVVVVVVDVVVVDVVVLDVVVAGTHWLKSGSKSSYFSQVDSINDLSTCNRCTMYRLRRRMWSLPSIVCLRIGPREDCRPERHRRLKQQ